MSTRISDVGHKKLNKKHKKKKYTNYLDNQKERCRMTGCTNIKIKDGKIISYRNKAGELIKKEEKTK